MNSSLVNNPFIAKSLEELGLALRASPPSLSQSNRLIFLCGGNREGRPSHRREAVKRFLESNSPENRVIYAEPVFNELIRIDQSRRKNALDVEHDISSLADRIVIVLESESAFCELGAFAHESWRRKLIVINDERFKSAPSFINTGPLAALNDAKSPVLWYPMRNDIIGMADGIGHVFAPLAASINDRSGSSRKVQPSIGATKEHLYFIHDLVHLCGPVSHGELIAVLKLVYGAQSYDKVSNLLGVLRAAELIEAGAISNVYRSTKVAPLLRYKVDFSKLLLKIRSFHLKNNPERFHFGQHTRSDSGGPGNTTRTVDRRTGRRAISI